MEALVQGNGVIVPDSLWTHGESLSLWAFFGPFAVTVAVVGLFLFVADRAIQHSTLANNTRSAGSTIFAFLLAVPLFSALIGVAFLIGSLFFSGTEVDDDGPAKFSEAAHLTKPVTKDELEEAWQLNRGAALFLADSNVFLLRGDHDLTVYGVGETHE